MKAIIKGHYISAMNVTWFPWWYNRIGETIDVYECNKDFFGDLVYVCEDNKYINVTDVILLSELRKQKLERILNNE